MYIEPCCIDKDLPPIVRQGFAFFQSNGDWTVQKLMSAVSHVVPSSVCVLVLPSVDVALLRVINHYLSRGWYKAVVILTAENHEEMVRNELSGFLSKVHYAVDNHVVDGQFILYSKEMWLVIQGALLLESDWSVCNYASAYGTSSQLLHQATDALVPMLKLRALITSEDEDVRAFIGRKE